MIKDLEKILKEFHHLIDKPKPIDIPVVEEEDLASSEETFPEEDAIVEASDVTGINTEEFEDEE